MACVLTTRSASLSMAVTQKNIIFFALPEGLGFLCVQQTPSCKSFTHPFT